MGPTVAFVRFYVNVYSTKQITGHGSATITTKLGGITSFYFFAQWQTTESPSSIAFLSMTPQFFDCQRTLPLRPPVFHPDTPSLSYQEQVIPYDTMLWNNKGVAGQLDTYYRYRWATLSNKSRKTAGHSYDNRSRHHCSDN